MTDEQERHLSAIRKILDELVDKKYRKGQAEHGGNLVDLSIYDLLNNAIDEAIDQVVYLLTLKSKLPRQP